MIYSILKTINSVTSANYHLFLSLDRDKIVMDINLDLAEVRKARYLEEPEIVWQKSPDLKGKRKDRKVRRMKDDEGWMVKVEDEISEIMAKHWE